MIGRSNLDPIRIEIIRLENAVIFDSFAWECVFAVLRAQDRPAGLADAQRRMETARMNQIVVGETECMA